MAVAPEVEALLRRTYDAFNRKDLDTAMAAAHPDVDWPNVLDGTRFRGFADLKAYFERQFTVLDAHVDVLSITERRDGAVIVRLRQVVRFLSDGAVALDEVMQHVYTFRDGLIEAMDVGDADGNLLAPSRASTSGA